jgi:hypothetical protein
MHLGDPYTLVNKIFEFYEKPSLISSNQTANYMQDFMLFSEKLNAID